VLAACSSDDADDADTSAAGDSPSTETSASSSPSTAATADELYPEHTGELYAGTANWICHPDIADDPCQDVRSTAVDSSGVRTPVDDVPAADPAFDCFYAYPTTSTDTEVNSDLEADASEINTVIAQVARYATACRVFAPVYRSITLAGLGAGAFGSEAREIAYGDVVDAWRTYVDEFGDGRGVVLIGHSQGAGLLSRLIEEEIGPDEAAVDRVISAVLMGTSVDEGQAGLPPCASADDTGCIISFSSYPADNPPVDGAIFGRLPQSGEPALCVNPVALAGGDGLADVSLPVGGTLLGSVQGFDDIDTPFVSLPGALRAECVVSGEYGYLAVSMPGVEDARPLDGLVFELLGPTWGLHLLDANLVQDDLIEVVTRQAAAHAAG